MPASTRALHVVCLLAVGCLLPGPATATDVTVTQGPAAETMLVSPMILDMDLVAAAPEHAGTWVHMDEFDKHICDYVHIRRIASRVVTREDRVDITLKVYTYTEPSRDKAVRMAFTLMHHDVVLGEALIPHIDAEEGKRAYGTGRMSVPKDRWPADGVPSLHIVVHVRNDD